MSKINRQHLLAGDLIQGRYVGKCEVCLACLLQCCSMHVVPTGHYTNVWYLYLAVVLSARIPALMRFTRLP